jgi:predicted phosphate transport protein (TIGR00153 family)
MSSFMGSLFGRSPIRPMQRHMQAAVSCAKQVLPLFEDMAAGRVEALATRRREIDRLEHEADTIKHEIRSHLPKRLFMAVERRDMLEILDFQDSIADVAQDIAGLADQRSMSIPEGLAEPLLDLVRRVLAACERAQGVIDELDELVETGFGDREVARVNEMINELSRIESDTDELAERAQRRLFAMEAELGVGAVFWYQMINWVADLADYSERVGNRLRLLIAR